MKETFCGCRKPADIQKAFSTGDRAFIEKTALEMYEIFCAHGGNLICRGCPSYGNIDVDPEWVRWDEDASIAHSDL